MKRIVRDYGWLLPPAITAIIVAVWLIRLL